MNNENKYLVTVSWTVQASVYVDAKDHDEAEDLARGLDLDNYENAEYASNSFKVDFVEAI